MDGWMDEAVWVSEAVYEAVCVAVCKARVLGVCMHMHCISAKQAFCVYGSS